jgi:hypothetical protein
MQMVVRLLLCLASLAAFAATACAQGPIASPSASVVDTARDSEWPSPDGKFAFLTSYGEDLHTIDLIDRKSGKKLQRVGEEDSSQTYWHVLWAPDSKRFALMARLGHPAQIVDFYFRNGDTFRKIELDLPEASIPEKLKHDKKFHGKKFPHYANINWKEASEWKKDGSLVVAIDTMIDGEGASITATRTVVLRFDRAGKARIVKSTIRYETETD